MRNLVIVFFVVLTVLHWDWWLWDSERLLWGFMPTGLAYQALISLLAVAGWAAAVFFAWPKHLDQDG